MEKPRPAAQSMAVSEVAAIQVGVPERIYIIDAAVAIRAIISLSLRNVHGRCMIRDFALVVYYIERGSQWL